MTTREPDAVSALPDDVVLKIVENAAHLLPAQGPIRAFIHHNTLHAFEDRPFEDAVVRAAERFGCQPFLEEEVYRQELLRGRIRVEDLRAVLIRELGDRANEVVASTSSRIHLRQAMLNPGVHEPDECELDWHLSESDEPADHALWDACRDHIAPLGPRVLTPLRRLRHRDALLAATGEDTDLLIHPMLIRFCAAFCDQGIAYWPMPGRDRGFFGAFVNLYRRRQVPDAWLAGLNRRLSGRYDPTRSIIESLQRLGVDRDEWQDYIEESLLALRGWPGMLRQIEMRPDRVWIASPPGTLLDYVAVRLILEEQAVEYVCRQAGIAAGDCPGRAPNPQRQSNSARAFVLYQVARHLKWTVAEIRRCSPDRLMNEIESFASVDRRRVFHLAYERRFRNQTLDALAAHRVPPRSKPRFQAVFCIDEREESFRRHLEEIEPDCETLGAAGFFGVAMNYRGALDAHSAPLCPIVIRPHHDVEERFEVEESQDLRRALGRAAHALHVGSRTGFRGSILSALFGTLATIPLVFRVLFPRHVHKLHSSLTAGCSRTQLKWDFTIDEMTDIVRRLLEETGLCGRLSRLVILIGHGSSSLNNPHESAHDCGACGGGRGGPNARAFALMANDREVRSRLAIAPDVVFVGAYHNSCNDAVEYFDLDRLPPTHANDLAAARAAIERARAFNALERCRRFDNAPLTLSSDQALRHVEHRTEDLAQVRPEYGHATNAVAVVGRRARTRGLYMDRRAFLISYDPTRDTDGSILCRILQAVGPVCAGISLEYYCSFVDPRGYGCATKLPHNIAGMLGVMDGHASDLRTGLPWQMVEIHEPVRLLLIVEAPLERLQYALSRLTDFCKLTRNRWVQLAALDPNSGALYVLNETDFERYEPESRGLPCVRSSVDWFRGRRDHLAYAEIKP